MHDQGMLKSYIYGLLRCKPLLLVCVLPLEQDVNESLIN